MIPKLGVSDLVLLERATKEKMLCRLNVRVSKSLKEIVDRRGSRWVRNILEDAVRLECKGGKR